MTPQEAIAQGLPRPSECDIVVAILWSRIGTPLPSSYVKPDGTDYLSGTEWEYWDAIEAGRREGRPSVWLYRRTEPPKVAFNDPDFQDRRDQWEKLESFFRSLVNEDGSIAGGKNPYETPHQFQRLLEQHLRDRLTRLLEEVSSQEQANQVAPEEEALAPPRWDDTPYPGLEAFTAEQAPIFFGRSRETDELLHILSDPAVRFVAVVGASGSGKSSLVAAGLIPRLGAGALAGSAHWRDLSFKPGERGGDPFLALAYPLKHALGTTGRREKDLADELRADPRRLSGLVSRLLEERPPTSELLLFIDQFEELFTLVGTEHLEKFLDFLTTAATTPRIRIVATLRADFYPQAVESPALAELFRGHASFPLAPPGFGALHEMVTGPAQAAGLELEDGLVRAVLDDTGAAPGALSLMAFALHELYERDKGKGRLSLDAYHHIGGVDGAIKRQANDTLMRLGSDLLRSLDKVFGTLVEVNEQGVATRRHASLEELRRDTRAGKLVAGLCDARLLVTGQGEANATTVEVAHEALLTGWPRLQEWIEQHVSELRARRDLERAASEWDYAERPRFSGLPSGKILRHYRRAHSPSALANAYLRACRRLQWLRSSLIGALATIALLVAGFGWWINHEQITVKMGTWVLLARLGLYYPEPLMVEVAPGPFEMGSADTDFEAARNEFPRHEVAIARRFLMGKYEVTFDEYEVFARLTNRAVPSDAGWGRGRRPVISVSWKDALAYSNWLRERTGKRYRLPSEAEWEYAARAGTMSRYSWGDEIGKDRANCGDCGSQWDGKQTAPVGSFEPNALGLYDTAGNVSEWVQDCWHNNYEGAPVDGSAWEQVGCGLHVLRGGSWGEGAEWLRSANRNGFDPDFRHSTVGFRVAQDP